MATLRLLKAEDLSGCATSQAAKLRDGINEAFRRHDVPGIAYGRSSILHIFLGDPPRLLRGDLSHLEADAALLAHGNGPLGALLRMAMLLEGVDLMGTRCFVSAVHSDADVEHTLRAGRGAQRAEGRGSAVDRVARGHFTPCRPDACLVVERSTGRVAGQLMLSGMSRARGPSLPRSHEAA